MANSPIKIQTPVGPKPVPPHGKEVTVVVDDLEFTIHYGFIRENRPTVVFTSRKAGEEISELFMSYKSLSEGFWRLAMGEGSYYKGQNDYVTQTFIHMALQDAFTKNWQTLPPPYPQNVDLYFKFLAKTIGDQLNAANMTNSIHTDRLFYDPVFEELKMATFTRYTPPGQRAKPSSYTFFLGEEPLRMFYEKYRHIEVPNVQPVSVNGSSSPRPSSPLPFFPLNQYTPPVPNAISIRENKKSKERNSIRKNSRFLSNLVNLAKQANTAGIPLDSHVSMGIFGKLVEANFEIVGSQAYVLTTQLEMPTVTDPTVIEGFSMDVYAVPIRNKFTDVVYTFFIGYYTYEGVDYKHLVNIVPSDAKILRNGLYSKYVSAGHYIYKPFDYYGQCFAVKNRKTCDNDYVFIGMAYQDMWPLTVLEKPGGSVINKPANAVAGASKGGRKKRTRRSKKKRSTRKRSAESP